MSPNIQLIILTALTVESAEVRKYGLNPSELRRLTGIQYDTFDYLPHKGDAVRVALAELGPGNVSTAAEVGRLAETHPDAVLLFVGIAGALKDLEIGDVVAATEIIYTERAKVDGGEWFFRSKMSPCTPEVVALARKIARDGVAAHPRLKSISEPPKRIVVGQIASGEELLKDEKYRDEISLIVSDALAIENEGYGFALAATGRMHAIVIRGISDNANKDKKDDQQKRAAAAAAAFAWSLVDLMVAAKDIIPSFEQSGTDLASHPKLPDLRNRAVVRIDQICFDEDLVDDQEADQVTELAVEDYKRSEPAFFEILFDLAVSRVEESDTWSAARLRRYVRACAKLLSQHNGTLATSVGALVDVLLSANLTGAAIALSEPDIFITLTRTQRRRVLSGLIGTQSEPRQPSTAALECISALVMSAKRGLSEEEERRIVKAVQRSPYRSLAAARMPMSIVARKVVPGLTGGTFLEQNNAARFLYQDASMLPQDITNDTDIEIGAAVVAAANQGAYGAREALNWTNLSPFPSARKAGMVIACLIFHGRLNLSIPRELRDVIVSAGVGGDLEEVLRITLEHLPTLDGSFVDDGDDFVFWKSALEKVSDDLTVPEDEMWRRFVVDVFREKVDLAK